MNLSALSFCKDELSTCKTVSEWNEKVKELSASAMSRSIRAYIESSGLIVKVLGMDENQPIYSN